MQSLPDQAKSEETLANRYKVSNIYGNKLDPAANKKTFLADIDIWKSSR